MVHSGGIFGKVVKSTDHMFCIFHLRNANEVLDLRNLGRNIVGRRLPVTNDGLVH